MISEVQPRLLTSEDSTVELEYLEDSILRLKGAGMMGVVVKDQDFDASQYRGECGYSRIRAMAKGEQRSLNKDEFARACHDQQTLELLACLFSRYGYDYCESELCSLGISKVRLMNTKFAHYYGEWAEIYDRVQVTRRLTEEKEAALRVVAEKEAALEAIYLNAVIAADLARCDQQGVTPVAKPEKGPLVVVETVPNDVVPKIYCVYSLETELDVPGCRETSAEQVESVNNADKLFQYKEMPVDAMATCQQYSAHVKWQQERAKVNYDYVSRNISEYSEQIKKFIQLNEAQTVYQHIYNREGRLHMTAMEIYECQTMIARVARGEMTPSDGKAATLLLLEDSNEKQSVNYSRLPGVVKSSEVGHLWDIHRFVPRVERHLILSVSWDAQTKSVNRVIVLTNRGGVCYDQGVLVGKGGYGQLGLVRRAVYMLLLGTVVYGFNVNQHLARLGLGAQLSRIIDLSQLPRLKGKASAVTIEKYQMRYGRSAEELSVRRDPMMDNAQFAAYMVNRDAYKWYMHRSKELKFDG